MTNTDREAKYCPSQKMLKKSLVIKSKAQRSFRTVEPLCRPDCGVLGRSGDAKVFKGIKRRFSDFVVDVLIDASGSSDEPSGRVALQAYIISESLQRRTSAQGDELPHLLGLHHSPSFPGI